jgi:HK97 family phage portal protein
VGRLKTALNVLFSPRETRAVLPWNVFGDDETAGTTTNSGTRVTETTAFKFSVAYAAMTLIADGIASLPPLAFRESADGSRTPGDIPQWVRKPHPEIRRFDVWNQLLLSVLAWGNAYAQFIRRQSDGVIVGLNVLDPGRVTVEWDPSPARAGFRRYKIENGPWLTSYDIFHIQGPTLPGKAMGMSVIAIARESIALGLTLEEFGARYFSQGSMAKIVLEIPGNNVDETKAKSIIRTFERFHRGKGNWHRPAIASGGSKIHNISIPPEDAQFLQTRNYQAVDVARWFRVPAHRVGITDASSSWGSGLAEENQAMLQHTYRPWIIRFQDALTAYAPGGQDLGLLIELDTAALLRGTFKEQADVFTSLYEKDVLSKNEARSALGYSKVTDGDKFFSESQPAPVAAPGGAPADPRTKEQDRLRKQEEAKRSTRENTHHDPHSGQFASKGGTASKFAGMKPATAEDKAAFKAKTGQSIPPAWTDVHVAENMDHASLLVKGYDGKGRQQSIYSAEHTKAQSEKKFARNVELAKHTDKLDAAIERDAMTNDEAGALMLIRKMGMRPGSNRDTGAKEQAHGATNLKKKHVIINEDGTTTLDFIGKKGVHIKLDVKDPQIHEVLKSRHRKKANDDDQLFDTNEDKVRDYMRSTGIPTEFLLKDLRTLHANTVALREIEKMSKPKTKAEFLRQRKQIAEKVSAELGNTPTLALQSYINPAVFGAWAQEGWL